MAALREFSREGLSLIIVDPIYKCAIGDENDAYDTGRLCNLIDKIAGQLGVAVIYAHHHSKGSQGQKKAMDRASGSGVISRDADALIDIVELEISKERRAALEAKVVCEALKAVIAQISSECSKNRPIDRQEMQRQH